MKRKRSARKARWFGVYTFVLAAVAALSLAAGQVSVGLTVLLAAAVFAAITWSALRRARRPR